MTPAVLALTNPAKMPAAAIARLRILQIPGGDLRAFTELADLLPDVAQEGARILERALLGSASRSELQSLQNASRVLGSSATLYAKEAVRSDGQRRAYAMQAAARLRHSYADIVLTQREHIPWSRSVMQTDVEQLTVRIGSLAEHALGVLEQDWLTIPDQVIDELASTLWRGVFLWSAR